MRGITVEYNSRKGGDTYTVIKAKGKLTIDEVQEALIEKGIEGYAMFGVPVGRDLDSGWMDEVEPKGDAIDVTITAGWGDCPFCQRLLPPLVWCPKCDSKMKLRDEWTQDKIEEVSQ